MWFKRGGKITSDNGDWYAYHSFLHPLGVVVINEFSYSDRSGDTRQTEFETVIYGFRYIMTVDRVDLSERSLKVIAGKFIREAIKKSQGL